MPGHREPRSDPGPPARHGWFGLRHEDDERSVRAGASVTTAACHGFATASPTVPWRSAWACPATSCDSEEMTLYEWPLAERRTYQHSRGRGYIAERLVATMLDVGPHRSARRMRWRRRLRRRRWQPCWRRTSARRTRQAGAPSRGRRSSRVATAECADGSEFALGAPGRPGQGRVVPRRRRRLLRRPARSPPESRRSTTGTSGATIRHGTAGSSLRSCRQPVPRSQLHPRAVLPVTCTSAMSPQYAPDLTVEHNGFVNGTAALGDYLAEQYPDAGRRGRQERRVGRLRRSMAASPPTCSPTPRSPCSPRSTKTHPGRPSISTPDPRRAVERIRQHARLGGQRRARRARLGRPTVLGPGRPPQPRDRPRPLRLRLRPGQRPKERREIGQDPADLLATIDTNEAAIEATGVVQHSYTAPR